MLSVQNQNNQNSHTLIQKQAIYTTSYPNVQRQQIESQFVVIDKLAQLFTHNSEYTYNGQTDEKTDISFFKNDANIRKIGTWDLKEEHKAHNIFKQNPDLIGWFKDEGRRKAFLYNLMTITQFYERDVINVYQKCGIESKNEFCILYGSYCSKHIKYAAAKYKQFYERLIQFGVDVFKNVTDERVNQTILKPLLQIGLHLAIEKTNSIEHGMQIEPLQEFAKMLFKEYSK